MLEGKQRFSLGTSGDGCDLSGRLRLAFPSAPDQDCFEPADADLTWWASRKRRTRQLMRGRDRQTHHHLDGHHGKWPRDQEGGALAQSSSLGLDFRSSAQNHHRCQISHERTTESRATAQTCRPQDRLVSCNRTYRTRTHDALPGTRLSRLPRAPPRKFIRRFWHGEDRISNYGEFEHRASHDPQAWLEPLPFGLSRLG